MNKTNNQKNQSHLLGLTGLLASAVLGAHLLFNTQKGKKSLKHIKSWAFKMKGEMLEKLEKVKDHVNEESYHAIVDELSDKYKKVKGMTIEEVVEISSELKSNWKKINAEAKKILSDKNAKSKKK